MKEKRRKYDGVSQVVDLKLTKDIKGKQIKKDGGWKKFCIWIIRGLIREGLKKKMGLAELWIWKLVRN